MVAEYVDPGFQAKLDEKDRIELEQAEFKVEANLYPDRFRKILKCNGELVYIRK